MTKRRRYWNNYYEWKHELSMVGQEFPDYKTWKKVGK